MFTFLIAYSLLISSLLQQTRVYSEMSVLFQLSL